MSVYEKNGKWYYNFMLYSRRKHGACKGCRTKSEALEFEAEAKNELSLVVRGKKDQSEILEFKVIMNDFLEYSRANKKKKSIINDEFRVKVLKEFFGENTIINNINGKKIESFKNYIINTKKLSNGTFNRYYGVLSKAFNLAIDNYDLYFKNPCKTVKKLKEDNSKVRYLTEDEEARLMQVLPDYLRPIIICALTTGLRLSNILNLRWETIDIEQNFLEILMQENKGHKKIQIPLSQKFKAELEKIGIKKEGYVFISWRTGTKYNNIRAGFIKALKEAKIENFRFHDLRHTVGTRLVANGADLLTVKQYLAHSNLSTTQRYMHPTPENMKKAVAILDCF